MKTDKTKLLQDIEAMKEKLASMEEELNKPDKIKHFPSEGDKYYFYNSTGAVSNNYIYDNDLRVNAYKTREEAQKAYNKAVALEKVKRRLLELQGDWEDDSKGSFCIQFDHYERMFIPVFWFITQPDTTIPFMKNEEIARLIIDTMEDELKLIFDIT